MRSFTSVLNTLHERLVRLAKLSLEQMKLMQWNLKHISDKYSVVIIETDKQLDQAYDDIQEEIFKLIIVQPPLAEELEALMTMNRVAGEIERIGDHMVNITKSCDELTLTPQDQALIHVLKMVEHTLWMHESTVLLLMNYDQSAANSIIDRDEEIDQLFHQFRLNVPQYLQSGMEEDIGSYMHLFLISRYLERSADHLVNITRRAVII